MKKNTCFLDGTGNVVETDGHHAGIHFLSSTILEEVSGKCTLAKVTKNLFFVAICTSLIMNNHLENCLRKMYTFLYDIDSSFPFLHRDKSVFVQSVKF